MTRRTSWFRSPRLRRKQLSNHRGQRSLAGDSRLHNRRLLLERLEDRSLLAAVPVMVDDLNTNGNGSGVGLANGERVATVGGVSYLPRNDGIHGAELWRTDGTSDGTWMVKDIHPGSDHSFPSNLFTAGGSLYFVASATGGGSQVWRTDGTAANTIAITPEVPIQNNYVTFTEVGGKVYFVLSTFPAGQLWVSDENGSTLLRTINFSVGGDGGSTQPILEASINGKILFWHHDSEDGNQLWRYDTGNETFSTIATINPVHFAFGGKAVVSDGKLYFSGKLPGNSDLRLWASDGDGVVELANFGSGNTVIDEMTDANGTMFCSVHPQQTNMGAQLWRSNGTPATTQAIYTFPAAGSGRFALQKLQNVNETLFFVVQDATAGSSLWKSDGATSGTVMVAPTGADNLQAIGNTLLFNKTNGLWQSDGQMISQLASPFPSDYVIAGDRLYHNRGDLITGQELSFVELTNGVLSSPTLVKDINTTTVSSGVNNRIELDGKLIFVSGDGVHGNELFVSDGTAAGTKFLMDINPGSASSNAHYLARVDDWVFFHATKNNVKGIWKTDGTVENTQLVTDQLNLNVDHPIGIPISYAGKYFFVSSDTAHGQELWSSDGTEQGTSRFADLNVGTGSSSPFALQVLDGLLYFTATSDGVNRDFFVTDGNPDPAHTYSLEIFAGSGVSWAGRPLELSGNNLFFQAVDPQFGIELWSRNQQTGVVERLTDTVTNQFNNSNALSQPVDVNGTLYFFVTTGANLDVLELWSSDGTSGGTGALGTVTQTALGTHPWVSELKVLDGKLHFTVGPIIPDSFDPSFTVFGVNQLWNFDPASNNTSLVHTAPSLDFASIHTLSIVQGELMFLAYDYDANNDLRFNLWSSDGTNSQIVRNEGATPDVRVHSILSEGGYVLGVDLRHGSEIWRLLDDSDPAVLPEVTTPAGSGTIIVERQSDDLVVTKDGAEFLRRAFGSLAGLTINGNADSEVFTINIDGLSAVQLPRGITIHAGEGTGDDDTLELNGSTTVSNYDYTTGGPEAGTLTLDGFYVNFTQFEPIIDQLSVTSRTFHIGTAGSQTIVLRADTEAGMSTINDGGSGAFESLSFKSPNNSLAVDAGDGDDTIIIAALDPTFGAALSVAGGAGNDVLDASTYDLPITLAGGPGNDELAGGSGTDSLDGGAGQDVLDGGAGADLIQADPAQDTVVSDPDDEIIATGPPTAAVAGPSGGVRGQVRTFTISATDPTPADVAAGFTYQINWGDGTLVETVAASAGNGSGVTVDHVFAASGSFTVAVIAIDQNGDVSTATTGLTTIAAMSLEPDPLTPGQTMLIVGGTTAADYIEFKSASGAGNVEVTLNGTSLGVFQPTGRLVAIGQGGDDDIQVSGSIGLSAWLYGDDGHDRLKGGNGSDVLLGGSGDDLLVGQSGRDLLIGGTGADRIVGNADDDVLIAGCTAHDDHMAALAAIMDEWTSSRTYSQRIANLSNGTIGGTDGSTFASRRNADYFLIVDATVLDDNTLDVLTGSAGLDWFFFNADGEGGTSKDKVTDLHASEFAADLDWIEGGI